MSSPSPLAGVTPAPSSPERPARPESPLGLLITKDDVAAELRVSRHTLNRMIRSGDVPAPDRKIGKLELYLRTTFTAWLAGGPPPAASVPTPTSAAPAAPEQPVGVTPGPRRFPHVSIYKPKKRSKERDKWLVSWLEERGSRKSRVRSVSTSLEAAERFADKMSRQIERRRRLAADQAAFVAVPEEERRAAWHTMPLAGHLDAYEDFLLSCARSRKHAQTFRSNIERVAASIGARTIDDFTRSAVQHAIASFTKSPTRARAPEVELSPTADPLSAQTRNHYLKAVRAFCTWLDDEGRILRNPLPPRRLNPFNVASDRRRVRRVVTPEQLRALVTAAEQGPAFVPATQMSHTIDGPTRADVYRLVLATALRAGEVRTLRVCDVRLEGPEPGVTVRASTSKNGKSAFLLISPELAAVLRPRVIGRPAEAPLFRLPDRAAEMLRFDLAAAGIPYRDGEGRVFDFHALRGLSASLQVAAGTNPKVVQERLRHSTITLTMDCYAQAQRADQLAAAAAVPAFAELKAAVEALPRPVSRDGPQSGEAVA